METPDMKQNGEKERERERENMQEVVMSNAVVSDKNSVLHRKHIYKI